MRCCFDDIAIVAVDGQDIAIGCDSQAKWIIEGTIDGYCLACMSRSLSLKCIRNSCNAIVQAICDIQGTIVCESHTGWSNHQGSRISSFGEARANDSGVLPLRLSLSLTWNA